MFETIFALLLTPWAVLSLVFIAVLFDHNEHEGWATITLLGVFAIAYFMFEATLMQIAIAVGAWLVSGVIYSWVRWVWQCKRAVRDYENESIDRHRAMHLTHVDANKGVITYWAFAWPVSLVATVLTDLLSWLGKVLHFTFGNAYNWISDNSRSQIAEIEQRRGK